MMRLGSDQKNDEFMFASTKACLKKMLCEKEFHIQTTIVNQQLTLKHRGFQPLIRRFPAVFLLDKKANTGLHT